MSKPADSKKFLGRSRSAGYVPSVHGGTLALWPGDRPFFGLSHVELMRRDPQVQFALHVLRAPVRRATWKVHARTDRVRYFVDKMLRRVWKRCLTRILKHLEYGYSCGEWVYGREGGLLAVRDLTDFYPLDAEPLVLNNRLVGLRLKSGTSGSVVSIGAPRFFWLVGGAEYDPWYGRSRYFGMWTPWMEKNGKRGALDVRRTWMLKNSSRGDVIRHPEGTTPVNGVEVSNQDLARQIVERIEAGGVLAMSNARDEKGEYAWTLTPPTMTGTAADVLKYPKDLDREILIGGNIPPEVVEASAVGSGWSGRSVPAQVFYEGEDQIVSEVIDAVDRQCLWHLVRANFGKHAYEIEPDSLVPKEEGDDAGGDGGPPPEPPPGGGSGGGRFQPYSGPRGGHGVRDPITGRVKYGVGLSLDAPAFPAADLSNGPGPDPAAVRHALLVAMHDAALDAAEAGKPEAAQEELDALAALAHGDGFAELLRHVAAADGTAADLADGWEPRPAESRGKYTWRRKTEAGHYRYAYGEKAPGEARAERQRNAARALEISGGIRYGEATPEHLAELADHLPALTLDQLRTLRIRHAVGLGGGRRKEHYVTAIRDFVRGVGRHEPEGTPEPQHDAARPDTPADAGATGVPQKFNGDSTGDQRGDPTAALDALQPGQSALVAGHRVKRLADGTYRTETDRHHVTGDAATVAAHLARQWAGQKPDRARIESALKRAADYDEPNAFTDAARADADARKMRALPDGARVVSLDADTRGRVGTLKKSVDEDGKTKLTVTLDNSPDVNATDFEPLDPGHSWRGGAADSPAPTPAAKTGDIFAGAPAPAEPAAPKAPAQPADAVYTSGGLPYRGRGELAADQLDASHLPALDAAIAQREKQAAEIRARHANDPGDNPFRAASMLATAEELEGKVAAMKAARETVAESPANPPAANSPAPPEQLNHADIEARARAAGNVEGADRIRSLIRASRKVRDGKGVEYSPVVHAVAEADPNKEVGRSVHALARQIVAGLDPAKRGEMRAKFQDLYPDRSLPESLAHDPPAATPPVPPGSPPPVAAAAPDPNDHPPLKALFEAMGKPGVNAYDYGGHVPAAIHHLAGMSEPEAAAALGSFAVPRHTREGLASDAKWLRDARLKTPDPAIVTALRDAGVDPAVLTPEPEFSRTGEMRIHDREKPIRDVLHTAADSKLYEHARLYRDHPAGKVARHRLMGMFDGVMPVGYDVPGRHSMELRVTHPDEMEAWRNTPNRIHHVEGSGGYLAPDKLGDIDSETSERRVKYKPKGTVIPGKGVVMDYRHTAKGSEYLLRKFTKAEEIEQRRLANLETEKDLANTLNNPDSAFYPTSAVGLAKMQHELASVRARLAGKPEPPRPPEREIGDEPADPDEIPAAPKTMKGANRVTAPDKPRDRAGREAWDRWDGEAKRHSIRPAELHAAAADVMQRQREEQETRASIIAQARKSLEAYGGGQWKTLRLQEGRGDADKVKGLDQVAGDLNDRYNFAPRGAHASDVLYQWLIEGTPPPPDPDVAYREAFDQIKTARKAARKAGGGGQPPDDTVPFSLAGGSLAYARDVLRAAWRVVKAALGRPQSADLSAAHAPKGGVTVGGTFYPGGEFIPSEVMARATPNEREAVSAGSQNGGMGSGHPLVNANATQLSRLPESSEEAMDLARAAREHVVGSDEDVCAENGQCLDAAYALAGLHPDAEVWSGRYAGGEDNEHKIVKFGDYFIDVTADQFDGGEPIRVFTQDDIDTGDAWEYERMRPMPDQTVYKKRRGDAGILKSMNDQGNQQAAVERPGHGGRVWDQATRPSVRAIAKERSLTIRPPGIR